MIFIFIYNHIIYILQLLLLRKKFRNSNYTFHHTCVVHRTISYRHISLDCYIARDIRVTHYLYIYHNCFEKSYATHIILLIINDTLSKCRLSYNIIAIFFSIAIYQNYYFENKRGEQRTLFHGSRRDEGV